jgi:hypothetical protein
VWYLFTALWIMQLIEVLVLVMQVINGWNYGQ